MMEIKDIEHARKVLWAALFEHGVVIEAEDSNWWSVYKSWNQYGGYFDGKDVFQSIGRDDLGNRIDWERTEIPDYVSLTKFVGTDTPNESIEGMIGKLVMKDESVYHIGTSHVNDMMRACVDALRKNSLPPEPDLVSKWNL